MTEVSAECPLPIPGRITKNPHSATIQFSVPRVPAHVKFEGLRVQYRGQGAEGSWRLGTFPPNFKGGPTITSKLEGLEPGQTYDVCARTICTVMTPASDEGGGRLRRRGPSKTCISEVLDLKPLVIPVGKGRAADEAAADGEAEDEEEGGGAGRAEGSGGRGKGKRKAKPTTPTAPVKRAQSARSQMDDSDESGSEDGLLVTPPGAAGAMGPLSAPTQQLRPLPRESQGASSDEEEDLDTSAEAAEAAAAAVGGQLKLEEEEDEETNPPPSQQEEGEPDEEAPQQVEQEPEPAPAAAVAAAAAVVPAMAQPDVECVVKDCHGHATVALRPCGHRVLCAPCYAVTRRLIASGLNASIFCPRPDCDHGERFDGVELPAAAIQQLIGPPAQCKANGCSNQIERRRYHNCCAIPGNDCPGGFYSFCYECSRIHHNTCPNCGEDAHVDVWPH